MADQNGSFQPQGAEQPLIQVTAVSENGNDALRLASLGYWVFPVHTADGDKCSCGRTACSDQGKHPRTEHGFKDASPDPATIEAWWEQWPDANIGIACEASDLVVVDIDPRHGGDTTFATLCEERGTAWTETLTADTGGGGFHLYFLCPSDAVIPSGANVLGPGIDIRAKGGYVVAPPSNHKSGKLYAWQPGETAPHPLPDWLHERLSLPVTPVATMDNTATVGQGQRNAHLASRAGVMRRGGFDEAAIRAALLIENAEHCNPPLSESEVIKIAKSVAQYPPSAPRLPLSASSHLGSMERVRLEDVYDATANPVDWLIPSVVLKGHITLLYAAPESGKTILALAWVAYLLRKGETVFLMDEESSSRMTAERLAQLGVQRDELDRLHYFPFQSLGLTDASVFLAAVQEAAPAFIVFDALADFLTQAGLKENDASDVTRWMDEFAVPAARTYGAGVLVLDHVTLDSSGSAPRGSSAKKAKTDIAWHVRVRHTFDRHTLGEIELRRTKDRLGLVPEHLTYRIGGLSGRIVCAPVGLTDPDSSDQEDDVDRRIIEALVSAGTEGLSRSEIEKEIGLERTATNDRIARLVRRGRVRKTGQYTSTRYFAVDLPPVADDEPVGENSPASPTGPGPSPIGGDRPGDGR